MCGFYLPDHARYDRLLNLPDEKDIAKALKEAMKAIEEYKPELEGVLPKDDYFRLTRDEKTKTIPNQLLKTFADIPASFTGDLFGQIYEYFLAEFARSEGSKGGEFFTPRSVVRLMVEMIEPHGGKVFDPACGSGGMFVQSAHFIEHLRKERKQTDTGVFVYGQEKTLETVNLTGFDAPTLSTLYLDKPMKDHTLMQTIARANRVTSWKISGVEKRNGEIVDYYNVFRNMRKALKYYAQGQEGQEDQPVREKKELFKLLDDAVAQGMSFCGDLEIDLSALLKSKDIFKNLGSFNEYADKLLTKDEWRKGFPSAQEL
jgi:hypothetical protein